MARWLGLAVAIGLLVAAAFGGTLRDFFVGDDFSALFVASRCETLADALDLRGSFRLSLLREVVPDADMPSVLLRPLVTLSTWLDHRWWGTDPAGYHGTALALHALNAWLVALLAGRLGCGFAGAALAGAAFALHGAHVEAVAWIAARADLLVTTAMLATLLLFLRWLEGGRRATLALCALAGALALFTKEMAATLPGLALLLAAMRPGAGHWRRALAGAGALAAVLAAYLLARWLLIGTFGSYHAPADGIAGALANALRFGAGALRHTLAPGDRIAHPDPDALRLLHAAAWLGLALAARLAGTAGWLARPGVCLAAAFAASTAPVAVWSTLEPDGQGTRLLYPTLAFACVGLGFLLQAGCAAARGRALAIGAAVVLLAVSALGTRRALEPWHAAADLTHRIVSGLREVAGGKAAYVLTNELPRTVGPAYACQNAFPPAIWVFVAPRAQVAWLQRAAWEELAADREKVRAHAASTALVRWDAAASAWVGPGAGG